MSSPNQQSSSDQNQTIVVLGASSAIAQAVLRLLAKGGTQFLLIGRSEAKLGPLAQDLRVRGAKLVETFATALDEPSSSELILARVRAFSTPIDHIFVAYGALGDHEFAVSNQVAALKILSTNFTSVVSHLVSLTPMLMDQKAGAVTVITSVSGDRGRQSNYFYGAAKGGLSLFLQGLRNRLQPFGVRVVDVKAGIVESPMTQHLKRGLTWSTPERVAPPIVAAMKSANRAVYIPGFWRLIMAVIRLIPEKVFVRLKM